MVRGLNKFDSLALLNFTLALFRPISDMGTGKSLQALVAIAMAHSTSEEKAYLDGTNFPRSRSLIVCPSTLVGHWEEEVRKFFGSAILASSSKETVLSSESVFTVLNLSGSRSERLELWQRKSDTANIVITSYSTIRADIDYIEQVHWCYCVLDEGHLLKNPKTGNLFIAISTELKILLLTFF
jgi:TATA-binding protein-associated factor